MPESRILRAQFPAREKQLRSAITLIGELAPRVCAG